MRPSVIILVLCALAAVGCGSHAERNATRGDLRRYREQAAVNLERLQADLNRFALSNHLAQQNLPMDLQRFLEWRHREWWNLTDSMAVLEAYEWETVEKLSIEAAFAYGYELRNFPRTEADIERFFAHSDDELVGLVRDVCAYVEFADRELLPLRDEIARAYETGVYEAACFQMDARSFLQWREREWNKLQREFRLLGPAERERANVMRDDLRRFRAARVLEGRQLVVDLQEWYRYDVEGLQPRLVDDVWRFSHCKTRELDRFATDVADYGRGASADALKLVDEIGRYNQAQIRLIPLVALDVRHFFAHYDRELGPLNGDVYRFWVGNIVVGRYSIDDLQRFCEHSVEESAELQADVNRFFSYARKEGRDFSAALRRFWTDAYSPGFSGSALPMSGSGSAIVFDDYLPAARDQDLSY